MDEFPVPQVDAHVGDGPAGGAGEEHQVAGDQVRLFHVRAQPVLAGSGALDALAVLGEAVVHEAGAVKPGAGACAAVHIPDAQLILRRLDDALDQLGALGQVLVLRNVLGEYVAFLFTEEHVLPVAHCAQDLHPVAPEQIPGHPVAGGGAGAQPDAVAREGAPQGLLGGLLLGSLLRLRLGGSGSFGRGLGLLCGEIAQIVRAHVPGLALIAHPAPAVQDLQDLHDLTPGGGADDL
jgi:hypothetical protein